jgi:hypothetical protein
MPERYTPIQTPQHGDAHVQLEAFIDNGALAIRTTDVPSSLIDTHAAIGCDQDQLVRITIDDFDDATGMLWTVAASPQLDVSAAWTRQSGSVLDEITGWTDFVEVTITAQAQAAGTPTKTKKIHIQTKNRKLLPVGQRPKLDD